MEELRVLIEAKEPVNGEISSFWFDLPIDEAEFLDKLGVEFDSNDYYIIEKKLPFGDDVEENTSIERLNELYSMYVDLPVGMREEFSAFLERYSSLDELHNYRNSISHYEGCKCMIDVARYKLSHDPAFTSLSEKCIRYFDFETYANHLQENGHFVETEKGIFEIPF